MVAEVLPMHLSRVLTSIVALSMILSMFSLIPFTVSSQPGAQLLPPAGESVEDTDSDGLYDYLVIEITVLVNEAGDYDVAADLNTSSGTRIYGIHQVGFLDVGTHVLTMSFEGVIIRATGVDGPYIIWATLSTDGGEPPVLLDQFEQPTAAYAYTEFEPPPAFFTGAYTLSVRDMDENGRYEFLDINFDVEVLEAKDFQILYSMLWYPPPSSAVYIAEGEMPIYLDVGVKQLTITIRGSLINAAEVNGPYQIYLIVYDTVDDVTRCLDMMLIWTDSYYYTEFEAGSATSPIILSLPIVNGAMGASEWNTSTLVDLNRPDMGNQVPAVMRVMNTVTALYICLDVVGDLTEDTGDYVSIAVDTGNDNELTDGAEDQFVFGGDPLQWVHRVYSEAVGDWIVHCPPYGETLPDHEELAWGVSFATSPSLGVDHRIYEISIPLALIGAAPASVVGLATNGNDSYGIYDASTGLASSWPYYLEKNTSLVDYGDVSVGWADIRTSATVSGTTGNTSWFLSGVNISLTTWGGELGLDYTEYNIDSTGWQVYTIPFEFDDEGNHTLAYRSRDLGWNLEATKYLEFRLDLSAPVSVASMSGTELTISATDALSGVETMYYCVDGGLWMQYDGPLELSGNTSHIVYYYSVDKAGNGEEVKTLEVEKVEKAGGFFGFDFWMVLLITALLIMIAIGAIHGMRRKAKESDAKAAFKDLPSPMSQMMDDTGPQKPPPSKDESPPKKPGG